MKPTIDLTNDNLMLVTNKSEEATHWTGSWLG